MKLDRSKFIATYKTEATAYLTTLNQGLVLLEKNPTDTKLLSELFRTAHTLKGASRMMGFEAIQKIAHGLEDLLGALQQGTKEFDSKTADQALADLDAIQKILDNVGKSASPQINSSDNENKDPASPEPIASSPQSSTEEYIRVPISRINQLLNLIGETVISKVRSSYREMVFKKLARQTGLAEKMLYELEGPIKEALHVPDELLHHQGTYLRASQEMQKVTKILNSLHQTESLFSDTRKELVAIFDDMIREMIHMGPVITELQDKMKEIRMLPCASIFDAFPRLVRDIARQQAKEVRFILRGEETELDKRVLDALKGSLIHLLRNAIDHGVESKDVREAAKKPLVATVTLAAFQESGKVVIEVSDDGPGIDREQVKTLALAREMFTKEKLAEMNDQEILDIVFTEGFSTSSMITDISGRGVGLDVVRQELANLKGTINLSSEKGVGTKIRLELPLTIAVQKVLLIEAAGVRWAIPTLEAEESLRITPEMIVTIENRMVIQVRGRSVPIIELADLLGIHSVPSNERRTTVVITKPANKRVGFIVDRVIGEEEVFIKNLGPHLGKVRGVAAATILASGEVVLILDPQDLASISEMSHPSMSPREKKKMPKKKRKILLVEDSLTTRELEKTILENHGFVVETAIDGIDALNKLVATRFDIVVADIQMPRMDGFELCHSIKSNTRLKEIPVIFVTALSKDEEKRKGIQVGAQAYISKSQFDQKNLLDTIERLV